MNTNFSVFMQSLEYLCMLHSVAITPRYGGSIEVWDSDNQYPLDTGMFIDCTKEPPCDSN